MAACECYDFVWSAPELAEFERIFVHNAIADRDDLIPVHNRNQVVFSTTLFYRQSKLTDEDRKDGFPQVTVCRPQLYFPQHSLATHIEREYARKLGAFDPYNYAGPAVPTRLYAVYFNNTPVDIKRAERDAVQVMVNDIFNHGEVQGSLRGKLFSAFSKQKNSYVHLENDDKSWRCGEDGDYLDAAQYADRVLSGVTHYILETRGGFHVLIDKEAFSKKKDLFTTVIRNQLLASGGFTEVRSHGVMPIAGTRQFGFPVRFWRASVQGLDKDLPHLE